MRARSQKYAAAVYEKVNAVRDKDWADYQNFCYRFPFIVRENGLMAALGFLEAKGAAKDNKKDKAALLLLKHYAELFEQFHLIKKDEQKEQRVVLQETVRQANLMEYRRLTQHALQLAEWFKRYAEGRGDK